MPHNTNLVPILMYHAVGQPVSSKQDRFLNVSANGFLRQIRAMAALGYQARTFGEIIEALQSGRSLPSRTFAVTFDDAYECIARTAEPILAAFGFPATLFTVSAWTESDSTVGCENGRLSLKTLDWEAQRRLISRGWEVGGHTRTHPHLDALDDATAYEEISVGKLELEAHLRQTLRTFCYPYGHFNLRTPNLVKAAGFAGACTVRSGLASASSNHMLMPRIKVGYRDGVTGLLYRLLVRPGLPTFRRNRRSHTTVTA